MRDRESLAWAAGLFEGEGHLRLNKGYPVIAITSIDRELLDRFASVVGFGTVYGPYGPYRNRQNEFYRYGAHGFENVQALISMMWFKFGARLRDQSVRVLTEGRKPKRRGLTWNAD